MTRVWVEGAPFSADPLDFDSFVHHAIFRSVFGSLVSQYHLGTFESQVAESWTSSRDFRVWKFLIKDNLKFSNGDRLSPESVFASLNRAAFVLKQRKSRSGFFEYLKGYDELVEINGTWPGMRIQGQELIFTFEKPNKRVLEGISFGLYSIVHPSLFDSHTGEWKDKKRSISSGAYVVTSWGNDQLTIAARPNEVLRDARTDALRHIEFRWDNASRLSADLVMGTSDETALASTHEFFGGASSEIGYLQCISWKSQEGPCGNLERRRSLRARFYKSVRQLGFGPVRSFFPTAMKGIHEMQEPEPEQKSDYAGVVRFKVSPYGNPIFSHGYNMVMKDGLAFFGVATKEVALTRQELRDQLRPELKNAVVDLVARGTGVLIEAPEDDIRFMFLSKEGIRLPDIDGRIEAELAKENFDPQVVNELIWDQAVVWPLVHYASGLWSRKGAFNFSRMNLVLPPTEFQWIGHN